MDVDRFLGGQPFQSWYKTIKDRLDVDTTYCSPILNTFPGNIADYGKPIKAYGKAANIILSNMSKAILDIQSLHNSLSERMIDLKECVNQLIFQEKTFATAVGTFNVDYSPFYSKLLEYLSVCRWLTRTFH